MNNEDKIIQKLIEIDEKVNNIVVEQLVMKKDIHNIYTQLDQQSVILKRLDEERVFTIEWVRRIEADVERIKTRLQVA